VGIRQLIEKHKNLSMVAGTIVLIGAVWFGISNLRNDSITPVARWYFTVDRGKTWFADDVSKIPPFDYHGQPAYRARIFSCDGGSTKWCGYIERCNPEVKAKIDKSLAQGVPMNSLVMTAAAAIEVERSGGTDADWVPKSNTKAYNDVTTVPCPGDPNKYPMPVVP
jgi:hypothetical protein